MFVYFIYGVLIIHGSSCSLFLQDYSTPKAVKSAFVSRKSAENKVFLILFLSIYILQRILAALCGVNDLLPKRKVGNAVISENGV